MSWKEREREAVEKDLKEIYGDDIGGDFDPTKPDRRSPAKEAVALDNVRELGRRALARDAERAAAANVHIVNPEE